MPTYQDPKREAKRRLRIERQSEKVTSAERRILTEDARRANAAAQWVDLSVWKRVRQLLKSYRSGSYECASCGSTIAGNKKAKHACPTTPTPTQESSAPASA